MFIMEYAGVCQFYLTCIDLQLTKLQFREKCINLFSVKSKIFQAPLNISRKAFLSYKIDEKI